MLLKNELLKKITLGVNIAASKPSTLPILNNLLLETQKDGKLKIIATDMEVGISTLLPVEVLQGGSITVPARKFFDIIKELPEGKLSLKEAEKDFDIKYLKQKLKENDNNIVRTSKAIGLRYESLHRKAKALGLI